MGKIEAVWAHSNHISSDPDSYASADSLGQTLATRVDWLHAVGPVEF